MSVVGMLHECISAQFQTHIMKYQLSVNDPWLLSAAGKILTAYNYSSGTCSAGWFCQNSGSFVG